MHKIAPAMQLTATGNWAWVSTCAEIDQLGILQFDLIQIHDHAA